MLPTCNSNHYRAVQRSCCRELLSPKCCIQASQYVELIEVIIDPSGLQRVELVYLHDPGCVTDGVFSGLSSRITKKSYNDGYSSRAWGLDFAIFSLYSALSYLELQIERRNGFPDVCSCPFRWSGDRQRDPYPAS